MALAGCQQPAAPPPPVDRFVVTEAAAALVARGSAACVEDLHTGLTWELKSDVAGLHDWRNTYSWFNPEEDTSELDYRGLADGGSCSASACDTWSLVAAVNAAGLCDHHDWRMPSRNELMSISDLSKAESPPTTFLNVFPHAQAEEYWTGYDYSTQHESAWAWSFRYGHDRVDWKREAKHVRLVRGVSNNLDSVKD